MQGKPYAPHEFSAPSQLAWVDQHLAPAPLGAEPGGSVAGQIHDREVPALGPVEQRGVSATHFCRPMPHADGPDSQLISVSKQSRPAMGRLYELHEAAVIASRDCGQRSAPAPFGDAPTGASKSQNQMAGLGPTMLA